MQGIRKGGGIFWWNEQPGFAVMDDLRQTSDTAGNDRAAHLRCLECNESKRFLPAGGHDHRADFVEEPWHSVRMHPASKFNAIGDVELKCQLLKGGQGCAVSSHDEPELWQLRECLQGDVKTFLAHDAPQAQGGERLLEGGGGDGGKGQAVVNNLNQSGALPAGGRTAVSCWQRRLRQPRLP